jgi:hypothetical protein
MGRHDTRDEEGSYGRFSDLEVKKLIIGKCAEGGYDHIASFHLHLPASCRAFRAYHNTLAFAYDILHGHLGHLVIFLANCLDSDGFIGIDALVKKYQSKNGPPKIGTPLPPRPTAYNGSSSSQSLSIILSKPLPQASSRPVATSTFSRGR